MLGRTLFESPPVVASLILGILFLLFFGLIPGLSQWCALREIVPHASLWIWVKFLVSIGLLVGWFCAFFLCLYAGLVIDYGGNGEKAPASVMILFVFFFVFIPTLILGAASGAIYGAVMQKLLKEPAVDPPG